MHISEKELARDLQAVLKRVEIGTEVIIERNAQPFAVLRSAMPIRRKLSECIAMLSPDYTNTIDADFACDVEVAIQAHQEPWEPPVWD